MGKTSGGIRGPLEPDAVRGPTPATGSAPRRSMATGPARPKARGSSFTPRKRPPRLPGSPFPRQADKDRLCLADYFAPVESNIMDVVALQVVTVGPRGHGPLRSLAGRRRLQRGLLCPWPGRADCRGHCSLAAPAYQAGTGGGSNGASGIPGATGPVLTCRTMPRCSNCCRPQRPWA